MSFIQGTLETERKFAAGENKSSHRGHMNMKKLDDETEEFQRESGWLCLHQGNRCRGILSGRGEVGTVVDAARSR